MDVKSVKHYNFDIFYNNLVNAMKKDGASKVMDIFKSSSVSDKFAKDEDIQELYDSMSLQFNVGDITRCEYFFLQKYSNDNISGFHDIRTINNEDELKIHMSLFNNVLFKSTKSSDIVETYHSIKSADKFIGKPISDLLPFGFSEYGGCTVMFTGLNLAHIIGLGFNTFIKSLLSEYIRRLVYDKIILEEHVNTVDFPEWTDPYFLDTFEHVIINKLVQGTYKYMARELEKKESSVEHVVLKPDNLHINSASLYDLKDVYIQTSLLDSDRFKQTVKEFKGNPEADVSNVTTTIKVKTTMKVFLRLVEQIGISRVKYYTSFKDASKNIISNSIVAEMYKSVGSSIIDDALNDNKDVIEDILIANKNLATIIAKNNELIEGLIMTAPYVEVSALLRVKVKDKPYIQEKVEKLDLQQITDESGLPLYKASSDWTLRTILKNIESILETVESALSK